MFLISCNQRRNYQYKITKIKNGDTCIWFVWNYELKGDTIIYKNSNESVIKIDSPYIINKQQFISK